MLDWVLWCLKPAIVFFRGLRRPWLPDLTADGAVSAGTKAAGDPEAGVWRGGSPSAIPNGAGEAWHLQPWLWPLWPFEVPATITATLGSRNTWN